LPQLTAGRPAADWTLHEQVATAALECGCQQKAAPLIKAVLAKFPDSLRAKRLQASRRPSRPRHGPPLPCLRAPPSCGAGRASNSHAAAAGRPQGMYYEAVDKDEAAEQLYRRVLEEEPSNDMILKRLVGRLAGAPAAVLLLLA
jgi:hypothetical protein